MAELIDKGALIDHMKSQWDMQDLYMPVHFEYLVDEIPTTTEAEIRNRAIDEFVNAIEEYYFEVEDSKFRPYLKGINLVSEFNIRKIAEQLKEE